MYRRLSMHDARRGYWCRRQHRPTTWWLRRGNRDAAVVYRRSTVPSYSSTLQRKSMNVTQRSRSRYSAGEIGWHGTERVYENFIFSVHKCRYPLYCRWNRLAHTGTSLHRDRHLCTAPNSAVFCLRSSCLGPHSLDYCCMSEQVGGRRTS